MELKNFDKMGKIEDLQKKIFSREGVEQRTSEDDEFTQITRESPDGEVKHMWTGPAGRDELLKDKFVEVADEPSHLLLYAFIIIGVLVLAGLSLFIYSQTKTP